MNFTDLTTLLVVLASVVLGAFYGALANKLISEDDKSGWIWTFYSIGGIAIILPIIVIIKYWDELFAPSIIGICGVFLSILGGMAILIFTKKFIHVKNIYTTAELDPIINRFTETADKNEIKLFGGDLNFLGNSEHEIDKNPQYNALRAHNFNRILIICEQPEHNSTKIRYGKILTDMPNVELRFYNPQEADLRVRGRILQVNGVNKLLMFSKIRSKVYKAIETDTANSYGALYNNIWLLIWSLGIRPDANEILEFKSLYR